MKFMRLLLVSVLLVVSLGTMRGIPAARAEGDSLLVSSAPFPTLAYVLKYQWHTFYGVNDSTGQFNGVAVDANGNVYVAGYSSKTWGSPLHAYSGGYDIIVMKLNSRGQYQWHTFYGTSPTDAEDGDDEAAGIAVDAQGNVYVTGYSDRNWKGPGNANPLTPHGGNAEYMFALKLDSSGAYKWHTFFQPGRANAIALGSASNVLVTGFASSSWGSPKHAFGGNLVVVKLNSSGVYQWHTYYGAGAGAADEAGYGIAADPNNNAYITGSAPNTWRGDGNAAPLHPFSGGAGYSTDMVVLKLTSAGNYQWHTFYGASGYDDMAYAIAVDKSGNSYVTGYSFDTWGSPLHALTSERDIAVLKLNTSGAHQWHTFYGSGYEDGGTGIAVDSSGNAYIAGWSAGSWLGTGNSSPKHPHSVDGSGDITVLRLNSAGAYQRHTFYGSDSDEQSLGIALGTYNNVFTTGLSQASWQGDANANPLHAHSGNLEGDGFVLKLSDWLYKAYLPVVMAR